MAESEAGKSSQKSNDNENIKEDSAKNRIALGDTAEGGEEVDKELDDLLESALKDFEKPVKNAASSKNTGDVKKEGPKPESKAAQPDASGDHPWAAEFTQFEDVMRNMLEEDPAFTEQLNKIADSANKAATATTDEEFAATLADTLKSISESAQSLGEPHSEEELSRILGNLGLGAEGVANNGSVPGLISMMQNMMQNLLSKELLYPALRDIVDKYPDWLAEKRASLEQQDYERYNQQFELMKQVCDEFEMEQASDSEEIKKARFERVLNLMQKMQECGHPPKELVEVSPELGLDEHGNVRLPGMPPDQCVVM